VAQQDFASARLSSQLKRYAILMTVMVPREKWTDERLDDLNKKVDDLRTEMREGFARIDTDIRDINRNLIVGLFMMVAAIIGSNAFF
jgi:tetrahydromethanopterin S-methyltransferase subunit G